MSIGLKDHPFAVKAYFKASLVLTFAFPKEQLQPLIPQCLELDTFDDKWAFLAVAVVDTKGLRPKGFPAFMGNDFILVGYRLFVKYYTNNNKRLRGLYILRSETNKRLMETLGNVFTHYEYVRTDIQLSTTEDKITVKADTSELLIEVNDSKTDIPLPTGSPFADWAAARRFAGPLPFTFSYDKASREVLIVEGVRENWTPKPVEVISYNIPFINSLELKDGRLANAFIIRDIPYYWKKGRKETWEP
jgi:uncharacterized protein YqjF (DUF2071 family)